jgi:hypothetical protein
MAVFRKLSDHVKGDTWAGLVVTYLDGGGLPIDITGCVIAMKFRYNCKTGTEVDELTTAGGEITLSDPTAGEFTIEPLDINWAIGEYYWDIQITYTDAVVKTYIQGTLKVVQDVTY